MRCWAIIRNPNPFISPPDQVMIVSRSLAVARSYMGYPFAGEYYRIERIDLPDDAFASPKILGEEMDQ